MPPFEEERAYCTCGTCRSFCL